MNSQFPARELTRTLRLRMVGRVLAGLFAAVAAQAADPAPEPGSEAARAETRENMAGIVRALAYALPRSTSDARYSDPATRSETLAALSALAENGSRLESHAAGPDAGFSFLAGSLARDTRSILEHYREERFAESRFLLHQVTDNCVACHSRLPDAAAHPLGRVLADDPTLASLPAEERVELEVATRQFERALASYEALFSSPSVAPADLDLLGALDGYLEVCLRVQQDPKRAAQSFARLAKREDVSPPLRASLLAWVEALRELGQRPPAKPSLAAARELLDAAQDSSRFPNDRRALVPYVAASGLLHRYLIEGEHSPADLAQAYYWLGLIESHVGRAFWLSQTEHFLEASIRAAPGEPSAEKAYTLLEEFVVSGYTGSAGGAIPDDVSTRLAQLRGLIDTAEATGAAASQVPPAAAR